jgi:hypothetical protein
MSIAMVEGYAFLEKLSWNAYNEATELISHIEGYNRRFGYYPESVHVDQIYRNRENRRYGLSKIKSKMKETSETTIGTSPKRSFRTIVRGAKVLYFSVFIEPVLHTLE